MSVPSGSRHAPAVCCDGERGRLRQPNHHYNFINGGEAHKTHRSTREVRPRPGLASRVPIVRERNECDFGGERRRRALPCAGLLMRAETGGAQGVSWWNTLGGDAPRALLVGSIRFHNTSLQFPPRDSAAHPLPLPRPPADLTHKVSNAPRSSFHARSRSLSQTNLHHASRGG